MSAPALPEQDARRQNAVWLGGTAAALAAWVAAYGQLGPASDRAVALLALPPGSPAAEAARFFLYETPKVLLLLTLAVFLMGIVRSFFSPERTRALLAGRREGAGNALAAALGTVTPFCSCSAVPLFIGFVSAGVPLGVTFSFLIAAPMVNEVALGLLLASFGWKLALAYLGFGLAIAVIGGWVIGRLRLEGWLQPWVLQVRAGNCHLPDMRPGIADRIRAGADSVREIVGRVWPWVLAGIAIGAGIHGYVPAGLLTGIMGSGAWWSVPTAVALGIPMYSGAAGILPVVEALIGKGAAIGTTLAFMMSVIALSLPEMIILRKVLTLRLIAVFVGIVALGILAVGYLFNLMFA